MNDTELNDVISTCGGPYSKGDITAMFVPSDRLAVKWTRSTDCTGKEYLALRFPESFRFAPISVIRDITKKLIQQICYSSDYEMSEETLDWISQMRKVTGVS